MHWIYLPHPGCQLPPSIITFLGSGIPISTFTCDCEPRAQGGHGSDMKTQDLSVSKSPTKPTLDPADFRNKKWWKLGTLNEQINLRLASWVFTNVPIP